jgi:CheY-like chemotaxis protein
MLRELGYRHHCAATPREALERLSSDSTIQIVIVNADIPAMEGTVFIEETRVRVTDGRAIAPILLTSEPTLEIAVKGLQAGAVDLLSKPLSFDAYSTAIRRAMKYLVAHRTSAESRTISDFRQQLTKLVATLENKGADPSLGDQVPDKEIGATLRTIINSRALRSRFFPTDLFADPAWDILLDLTKAKLENRQVSVSSVCIAASVPMSTALRWVRQMTEAGLLQRWTDPNDRRRDLIALTDPTEQHMRDYLAAVYAFIQKI